MTPAAILNRLDAAIAAQGLLRHPFYQAWTRGELTLDALRDYAAQYYHHVAAFPTYVSAVHAQSDDLPVRRHLLSNLIDEEAASPNHPELWLQFADALGVPNSQATATQPWPETRQLIDTFRQDCGTRGVAAGTAALYAYESQIPAVAETKMAGLRSFYGIAADSALAYFAVHEQADREHAATERNLLAGLLTEDNTPTVTRSVDQVLAALNEMLSGVCRRHNIAETAYCPDTAIVT